MDIKSCIFDLDGTLLNTLKDITTAVNITLESFRFEKISVEQCRSYIGSGSRVLLERAVNGRLSDSEFAEMYGKYMFNYRNNLLGYTVVYDGIFDLLNSLLSHGIKLSVCSNKPDDCVKIILPHFFKDVPFIAAFGNVEGVPVKPNAYFPLKIIEISGVPKENTVIIGDSYQDVLTGKNTGIKALSVLWGYQDREQINGDTFFSSPEELKKYILTGK